MKVNNKKININDKIELKIEKIVFGGEGLGYYNNFAIFVPLSVPNDLVKVKIISVKKNYARGLIEEIIIPSDERVKNNKINFEDFSGCDFAMLNYESQLKYKLEMLNDVLKKIAGIDDIKVDKIHPSDIIYNYRNKIIEPFALKNNRIISGFYQMKSHDIFEVEENVLNSKLGNKIINELKILLNKNKISVYDEKKHSGILRNIMIRTNSYNEAMVVLIINSNKSLKKLEEILLNLKNRITEIKSLYISLNTKKANTLIGDKNILIAGQKTLKENIEDIHFNISPTSFFQINLEQAKKLYSIALSYFSDIDNKNIVDAYSGTGTLAMILSKKAKKVFAIEIIKEASYDGYLTAKENNISNIEFINGKVENKISALLSKDEKIDAIIFDPPRKGLEKNIIDEVVKANIKEIVYISCNPSTLARDIRLFLENGYKIQRIEAVDMFPQTSHIECVVLLTNAQK